MGKAEALAARGFDIFPIKAAAKAPPLWKDWPAKAAPDASWWGHSPLDNIGIHAKGMLILDIDPKKGGYETIERLKLFEDFPRTLSSRTPSGGEHWYYRLADQRRAANTVELLGPGVDTRSENGYVVAPGSTTAAGEYRWIDPDVPIADAPDWLVERVGTPREKTATEQAAVPDAAESVVERAAAWLRTAERSVKGQGGDQAAYRVATTLRDMGVSEAQCCELMRSDAWDLGCGWREGWLEAKPIRSAYRYAQNAPGVRAALPDDFPVLEMGTIVPKKRTALMRLDEFAAQDARGAGYVIKGLLQRASYAEIYGAPGEGKTFVTLDMAYNVAAGREWMGHKVHAGPVLYLAFEGRGGLVGRAKALRQKYGEDAVPLYVAGASFSIRDLEGRAELGKLLALLPEKPVMIVFDTFAKALMGGDENSAQDVGAFNNAVEALIESTGACVAIVHHSGKDKSKGARGSSALLGAIDTEIQVDDSQVISQKQRDLELAQPIGFRLMPVMVGMDADGDDQTSCVVEPAQITNEKLGKITGNAKRAFDLLCEKAPNNEPVDIEQWRHWCVKEFLPAARSSFHDLKKKLTRAGFVEIDAMDRVTRRME